MKLQFNTSPTIASEEMEVSRMGVAEGAGDMLSSYLRDKIYTDKVLACVRETITNARDEHVKFNVTQPVEVKLSKINQEYVWSVRDYAKGLSETNIRTIFGMYGGSDKRGNNDQVGGFGIGALSPFAVSDSFYVTSYHEGFKTQYACILGAGAHGVPVGEIYKVSDPEPTSETGLEVSLPVTDQYDFDRTTKKFVNNFLPESNIIYTDVGGYNHEPMVPIFKQTVDGFVFNLYDKSFDPYSSHAVAIRMGGVVYEMNHRLAMPAPNGKIVVDVPIGKLSIPISREELEVTAANTAVLEEIENALKVISDAEASTITKPKFGAEVMAAHYSGSKTFDWFTHNVNNVFYDVFDLRRNLVFSNNGTALHNDNGKYMVYLIPDIDSYRSWIRRLNTFYAQNFPTFEYAWVKNTLKIKALIECGTIDLSDVNFIDVKKIGLPKLMSSGDKMKYVANFCGHRKGDFTPDELEDFVTKKYSQVDMDEDWVAEAKTIDVLNHRTIGLTSKYGSYAGFWTSNSKKLCATMYELGWLDPTSDRYKDRVEELNSVIRKQRELESLQINATSVMWRVKPNQKAIARMVKNPDRLNIFKTIKSKILAEDSPRARILKSMDNYSTLLTRNDLRKIMNLK